MPATINEIAGNIHSALNSKQSDFRRWSRLQEKIPNLRRGILERRLTAHLLPFRRRNELFPALAANLIILKAQRVRHIRHHRPVKHLAKENGHHPALLEEIQLTANVEHIPLRAVSIARRTEIAAKLNDSVRRKIRNFQFRTMRKRAHQRRFHLGIKRVILERLNPLRGIRNRVKRLMKRLKFSKT